MKEQNGFAISGEYKVYITTLATGEVCNYEVTDIIGDPNAYLFLYSNEDMIAIYPAGTWVVSLIKRIVEI